MSLKSTHLMFFFFSPLGDFFWAFYACTYCIYVCGFHALSADAMRRKETLSIAKSADPSNDFTTHSTGVISSILVTLDADLSNRLLTTLDKSLITSCTALSALFASPLAGALADGWGRKTVVLGADVLFVAGALWQAWSLTVGGMIVGRCLVGVAVGGASFVVPL